MNFDDFVHIIYGKNVFHDDENIEYIRDFIFPFLIPLVRSVNQEKEKHKYFKIVYDCGDKKKINNLCCEKNDTNIDHVNIFDTDKLEEKPTVLFEIQQEILTKYVKTNPILLLSQYLEEECRKNK
ncbi:conserved Plasmodium protein, unknown function [Plasmodium gallinaceum]|uniref:Uncharacterized protein n=1 Tax=Plasmodium gallinaceum TaxID=5849 RepID=A0A1J1GRS8_PLAGA|nr:conserved Plasmodium protein, unknown function [Plasmodium gallinaceum]CRG95004.1 conserved Plasmodium protein, unknown function [Plasmodium gallinaceum]